MSTSILYSGPCKIHRDADATTVGGISGGMGAIAFQNEGENGNAKITLNEDTAEYAAAMFGRVGEQVRDQVAEVTFKPFDNWGSLPQLYPPWLGISVGGTTGAIQVGGRPHGIGGQKVATKVWTPDGRLYHMVRTAVVGHPSLHLGIGKALFGDARIAAIGDETKDIGDASFLFAGNAATESAAADPGGAMIMSDFVRSAWTGVWGTQAGFGGDGGDTMQAEEEWTVDVSVKYSPLKVQGRTYAMKLDSVSAMARLRPYGPSHSNILTAVGLHKHGQRLGAHDLVLTTPAGAFSASNPNSGPGSKTITLKNAEVRGAGFDFGGTTLGTGEIAFVVEMVFTAGNPQPVLIFSA